MAIEAQQFTQKDELIAKFYTLRAGLSAIAEENQKLTNSVSQISKKIYENSIYYQELKSSQSKDLSAISPALYQNQENAKLLQLRFENLESEKDTKVRELSKLKQPDGYKKLAEQYIPSVGIIIFLSVVFSVFGIILSIILHTTGLKKGKKLCETKIVELENEISTIDKQILNTTQELSEAKNILAIHNKKRDTINLNIKQLDTHLDNLHAYREKNHLFIYDNIKYWFLGNHFPPQRIEEVPKSIFKSKYDNEIDKLINNYNRLVSESTVKIQTIVQALHNELDNIIMESDWENVDLLILYLNTGRADSLKEALNLVDKQKQTNQITEAIENATEYLANTITANTYCLSTVITKCCEQLSNQINSNHRETILAINRNTEAIGNLSGRISALGENLDSLGTQIEDHTNAIISTDQLNASLLAQLNRSSENLMYELKYNQRYWVK